MTPELKEFIEQARFYKASALRVAEMLPADDAALDELVAEVVRDGDQKAFMLQVIGRQVCAAAAQCDAQGTAGDDHDGAPW